MRDVGKLRLDSVENAQTERFPSFLVNKETGVVSAMSSGSNVTVAAGETLLTLTLTRAEGAEGETTLRLTVADAADESGRPTPWRGTVLEAAVYLKGEEIVAVTGVTLNKSTLELTVGNKAALWCCAVVGLCLGAGFYTAGLLAYLVLLPCLALLPRFENHLKDRSNHFEVHLELKKASFLQDFIAVIRALGLTIDEIELNTAYVNSGLSVYTVSLTIKDPQLQKYKTHGEIIEGWSEPAKPRTMWGIMSPTKPTMPQVHTATAESREVTIM